MNSIEFKNISFTYSKETVLDNVSLEIKSGQYVSLIGPNGSGKSTIAKLIIGLLRPSKGEILVNGTLLSKESIDMVRQKVGIVFQNPDNQFIGSTVEEDIAFGLENRCVPPEDMKRIIKEKAADVGMLNYLDKDPSNLSGGQKQRVAIAGILALEPNVLILDESSSMLDPKGRDEVHAIIRKMRENNRDLTIISITHDVYEIAESDRVILLDKGVVKFDSAVDEFFNNEELVTKYNIQVPLLFLLKKELGLKDVKNMDEVVKVLCPSK